MIYVILCFLLQPAQSLLCLQLCMTECLCSRAMQLVLSGKETQCSTQPLVGTEIQAYCLTGPVYAGDLEFLVQNC